MSFKDTTGRAFFLIKNHCFWRLFYVGKNYNFVEYFNRKTKRKMKQIPKIMLFCFILILSSCEKEDLTQVTDSKSESISISNAKKWFEEFRTTENFDPMFTDQVYDWKGAYVSTLTDGSKAIAVPVIVLDPYIDYSSKKLLYLYPSNNEKEFSMVLFELITDSKSNQKRQNNQDEFNLDTFDGYIINWDLTEGFVKGSKYSNSIAVCDIDVKVVPDNELIGAVKHTGKQEVPIELNDVIIKASGGKSSIFIKESKYNKDDAKGSTAYDHIKEPRGGGGAGSGTTEEDPEKNPCDKIKESLNNPLFKSKLDDLKSKTRLTKESGFSQDKNGTFTTLTADGSDAVIIPRNVNTIGYMHTHLNTYDKLDANGDLEPVYPIKMFSPEDVRQFLIIVVNAQYNNIPIRDTYGVMVSSTGTYQLKFTGTVADINIKSNSIAWGKKLDGIYEKYLSGNKEAGFLKFLNDIIGIDGIELYKMEAAGSSRKTLDNNGKITTINCN
jgi:hypothetical protein